MAFCNAKRGWFARQILSGRIQFMQITTKCGHEGQCMAHSSACLSHSVVPSAVAGTYHVRYIPLLAQNISSKIHPHHTYTDQNAVLVTLWASFTLSLPLFLNLLNVAVCWRVTQSPRAHHIIFNCKIYTCVSTLSFITKDTVDAYKFMCNKYAHMRACLCVCTPTESMFTL